MLLPPPSARLPARHTTAWPHPFPRTNDTLANLLIYLPGPLPLQASSRVPTGESQRLCLFEQGCFSASTTEPGTQQALNKLA